MRGQRGQPFRLPRGGLIRRDRPLTFRFDGRELEGYDGDTLASALLANGVSIVGRSFKRHRPRGLLGAGFEECNAIVDLIEGPTRTPNQKATCVQLSDGLDVRSVHAWPSASRDLGAVLDLLSRFTPGGFYYKTFMAGGWKLYEPLVRRAAGLGRVPEVPDEARYEHQHLDVDVLVVGGGPSGIAAARTAIAAGARVALADDAPALGGQSLGSVDTAAALPDLTATAALRVLLRTTALAVLDHGLVVLVEDVDPCAGRGGGGLRQRLWKVRARTIIAATGAFERPMVFPNNDRPGIMLAGALRTYLNRYAVVPGHRIALVTNNDSAYGVAEDLLACGVTPVAVIDSRNEVDPARHAALRGAGVPVHVGFGVRGARGRRQLQGISLAPISPDGILAQRGHVYIQCDCLAMSGGWSPAVHLYSQARLPLAFDPVQQCFVAARDDGVVVCVGAAAGRFDRRAAEDHSRALTAAACHRLGLGEGTEANSGCGSPGALGPWLHVEPGDAAAAHDSWVDFHNDVTIADVELAVRENMVSVEHVKRYTTWGMAVDQGKTSATNGIELLARLTSRQPQDVGTTTFRPPFEPVSLGAIAGAATGARYHPLRHLSAEAEHERAGAVFEDYSGWRRPAWYTRSEEGEAQAIRREAIATRTGVGLFDASPLGKIEVFGPDAAEFLDRIYVNNVHSLSPGRARYGLMLNEHGIILDDGILTRIATSRFLVGTTSGNASRILAWLEEWHQTEWPQLELGIVPVTAQWATVAVAGPRARELLGRLAPSVELDAQSFPHMSFREGLLGEVPVRVLRASFTGELTFEVSVPATHAASLWSALIKRGRDLDATPLGIESLMLLRIEKGFMHVGTDTDGNTTPDDMGYAGMYSRKQADFIGRRSLGRPDQRRNDRRQFVGLRPVEHGNLLPAGAHLIASGPDQAGTSQGWISSSCMSPHVGDYVALGLLAHGRERHGETVTVCGSRHRWLATVVPPCAFDPAGARLNA